jgi:hypothetical protein
LPCGQTAPSLSPALRFLHGLRLQPSAFFAPRNPHLASTCPTSVIEIDALRKRWEAFGSVVKLKQFRSTGVTEIDAPKKRWNEFDPPSFPGRLYLVHAAFGVGQRRRKASAVFAERNKRWHGAVARVGGGALVVFRRKEAKAERRQTCARNPHVPFRHTRDGFAPVPARAAASAKRFFCFAKAALGFHLPYVRRRNRRTQKALGSIRFNR